MQLGCCNKQGHASYKQKRNKNAEGSKRGRSPSNKHRLTRLLLWSRTYNISKVRGDLRWIWRRRERWRCWKRWWWCGRSFAYKFFTKQQHNREWKKYTDCTHMTFFTWQQIQTKDNMKQYWHWHIDLNTMKVSWQKQCLINAEYKHIALYTWSICINKLRHTINKLQ